jgi:hypothetical protein
MRRGCGRDAFAIVAPSAFAASKVAHLGSASQHGGITGAPLAVWAS